MIAGLVEAVLSAVLPPRCNACDRALQSRTASGLCGGCSDGLPKNNGPRCELCDEPESAPTCVRCATSRAFTRLAAPYVYGGAIAELVATAKFSKREDVARGLGILLAASDEARRLGIGVSAVVPVPLSARRLRERGFNQSVLLARPVARRLGLPLTHALERLRHTQAQSDLPLGERQANVAGAFASTPVSGVVLLVDDVATSSATAEAAAAALIAGGAQEVRVLALARTAG